MSSARAGSRRIASARPWTRPWKRRMKARPASASPKVRPARRASSESPSGGADEPMDPTLPTSRGAPRFRLAGPPSLATGVCTVCQDPLSVAAGVAVVVFLVDLGAGGADRIPVRDADALHVSGGGVAAVGIEQVAVVGDLPGDLPGGCAKLRGVDARPGRRRGAGGEGRPYLGARPGAGARRAVVLLEEVERAAGAVDQDRSLGRVLGHTDRRAGPAAADAAGLARRRVTGPAGGEGEAEGRQRHTEKPLHRGYLLVVARSYGRPADRDLSRTGPSPAIRGD